MELSSGDWQAIVLSFQLAFITTVTLLLIASPLAYWLVTSPSRLRPWVSTLVTLPLVLPPTVLGFYMLVVLSPSSVVGQWLAALGIGPLVFSFEGLVLASVVYSMPFVVQPIQNAMQNVSSHTLDLAASMGAGPWDRFFSVLIPQSKSGFLTAAVLGFTHTVGEFGIVLMMGGNIAGETRVVSLQLYDHVEALAYSSAHMLAAFLVVFSFAALLLLNLIQGKSAHAIDGKGRNNV